MSQMHCSLAWLKVNAGITERNIQRLLTSSESFQHRVMSYVRCLCRSEERSKAVRRLDSGKGAKCLRASSVKPASVSAVGTGKDFLRATTGGRDGVSFGSSVSRVASLFDNILRLDSE